MIVCSSCALAVPSRVRTVQPARSSLRLALPEASIGSIVKTSPWRQPLICLRSRPVEHRRRLVHPAADAVAGQLFEDLEATRVRGALDRGTDIAHPRARLCGPNPGPQRRARCLQQPKCASIRGSDILGADLALAPAVPKMSATGGDALALDYWRMTGQTDDQIDAAFDLPGEIRASSRRPASPSVPAFPRWSASGSMRRSRQRPRGLSRRMDGGGKRPSHGRFVSWSAKTIGCAELSMKLN